MSWLLEILVGAILYLGRKAALRDRTRPRWFNYSLAISYYVLPTLVIVSVFISWKITLVAAGLLIAILIAGAVTEADDIAVQ